MHESYKKWLEDGCPKVYCNCGCGGEIIIKKYHKHRGIPKYIHGHNPTKSEWKKGHISWNKNKGKIHKSYQKWLDDGCPNIFCDCGCNEEIIIKKYCSWHGIPKYIRGHCPPSEETKEKIREANLGKRHTEETKQKMRENNGMLGKHHTKEAKQKIRENNGMLGKYHLEETKQKLREANLGENNPNWNGGITPLNTKVRYSNKYQEWRLQIFGRDNFTCQACGIRGTYLEVHHIKPFKEIIKENNITKSEDALNCQILWNLDNGITYCKECHDKLKKKGGILER